MKAVPRAKIGFHVAEAAFSVLILLWYLVPLVFGPRPGGFSPWALPTTILGSPATAPGWFGFLTALVYLVPVICLWKIASIFLVQKLPIVCDPEQSLPIVLDVVSSAIVVALVVLHIVNLAANASYFAAFPVVTYLIAAIALGYNAFWIVMLIMSNSKRDVAYQEYLEFRRTSGGTTATKTATVVQRQGIQRKLMLTFVPLILVVIFALAFLLLRNFSSTILASVYANGEGLAERTASVVKANPGDKDRISLDDYFDAEAKKNFAAAESSFHFNTLSFYRRDVKSNGFQVWTSTDGKLVGQAAPALTGPLMGTLSRYNTATKSYEFLAPVTLSNVFIGYVMVDYARDVIYEPYFRTQVKVFTLAALFMYLSVFLIYVFGRNIVFPILFLRMSVNSIANVLSGMVRGKLKFSPELLQYKDRVNTHDEIKLLSGEVSHMTTVIRGVIPYISQSTLKHS
ncbi:MAG TPA: hypothetical protein VHE79_14545, partial [Spirochaetia bacterium]